jgi:hypothetical protein
LIVIGFMVILIVVSCQDLLRRMLQGDPSERVTIPEIFNHVWLRSASTQVLPELSSLYGTSPGQSSIDLKAITTGAVTSPDIHVPLSPNKLTVSASLSHSLCLLFLTFCSHYVDFKLCFWLVFKQLRKGGMARTPTGFSPTSPHPKFLASLGEESAHFNNHHNSSNNNSSNNNNTGGTHDHARSTGGGEYFSRDKGGIALPRSESSAASPSLDGATAAVPSTSSTPLPMNIVGGLSWRDQKDEELFDAIKQETDTTSNGSGGKTAPAVVSTIKLIPLRRGGSHPNKLLFHDEDDDDLNDHSHTHSTTPAAAGGAGDHSSFQPLSYATNREDRHSLDSPTASVAASLASLVLPVTISTPAPVGGYRPTTVATTAVRKLQREHRDRERERRDRDLSRDRERDSSLSSAVEDDMSVSSVSSASAAQPTAFIKDHLTHTGTGTGLRKHSTQLHPTTGFHNDREREKEREKERRHTTVGLPLKSSHEQLTTSPSSSNTIASESRTRPVSNTTTTTTFSPTVGSRVRHL